MAHAIQRLVAGGLDGLDRDGTQRRFPLLSVSIAAVEVDGGLSVSADLVAERLRQTKTLAKAKPGCSCLLTSGSRVIDLLSRPESPAPIASEPAMLAIARA